MIAHPDLPRTQCARAQPAATMKPLTCRLTQCAFATPLTTATPSTLAPHIKVANNYSDTVRIKVRTNCRGTWLKLRGPVRIKQCIRKGAVPLKKDKHTLS